MDRVQRELSKPGGLLAAVLSRFQRVVPTTLPGAESDFPAPVSLEDPFACRPRILVVDDNPSNQSDVCELLACWGITPMLAADGAEAVALACGHDFDLILMDLQMPVLDGLAATTQIRRHEREHSGTRAPVVAYTSSSVSGSVLRDCGVDAVLEKPCDAKALQDCLLRWYPALNWLQAQTSAIS